MEEYAIIILAAGSSSRLGRAKQLLNINGKTMLKHTIDEAQKTLPNSVFVVIGANAQDVKKQVDSQGLHLCYNPDWELGMASSIQSGLKAVLTSTPAVKGCLISVCDQPFLTSAVFSDLISRHQENPSEIIASSYHDTAGVPVLFGSDRFSDLMKLKGQEGAKTLLKTCQDEVVLVPFPGGEVDIDTPGDYRKLLAKLPL